MVENVHDCSLAFVQGVEGLRFVFIKTEEEKATFNLVMNSALVLHSFFFPHSHGQLCAPDLWNDILICQCTPRYCTPAHINVVCKGK